MEIQVRAKGEKENIENCDIYETIGNIITI